MNKLKPKKMKKGSNVKSVIHKIMYLLSNTNDERMLFLHITYISFSSYSLLPFQEHFLKDEPIDK